MTNKKILLAALLLAILTIGAVNASDDNATSNSLTSSEDANIESPASDGNLQTSPESNILANTSNATGTFTELNDLIKNSEKNSVVKLNMDYAYNNDTDYSFMNGIDINKRIAIDGQGHTINGNNLARMFTENENNISLRNINFINLKSDISGMGVIHNHRERGSFINCSFTNCSSSTGGGAITCEYDGTISNCTFTNCFANKSDDGGGAISIGGECIVSDCRFVNCSADGEGGAVRALGNSNIINCEFVNCSSKNQGGAIRKFFDGFILNCSFINCPNAIYCNGNNTSVLSCKFMNCYREDYSGAITITDNDWTISDCEFVNCSSLNSSGALGVNDRGVISGCSFINCSSNNGGGGAIDAWIDDYTNNPFINITGCSFINCSSKGLAGAIWGRGALGCVADCIFEKCHSQSGGAICTDILDISGCSFINCYGQDSGAISGRANITGCSFINCSAVDSGGAINWGSNDTRISSCIFVNCSSYDGGAIFCGDMHLYNEIYNCSFTDCSAVNGGGAITGTVCGSIISCIFVNCLTENNEFSGGGAICVWDSDRYAVIDCSFVNCYSNAGGAISSPSSNGSIISSSFVNCLSDNEGGAIDICGENTYIGNCSFEKCSSDYGGAIFMNQKNNTVSDCEFKNNTVYEDGGAIYSTKEITVDNCTFYDNAASYSKGGAIYANGLTAIENSVFKGNNARKGKAIYTDESDITLTSNKLTHPAGESRNDLIYGVAISTLKNTNEVYNGDRLVIAPDIDISYKDLILGENESVKVTLPKDAPEKITITLSNDGKIIKTATYTLNDGAASETYSNLGLGVYNITVGYPGDVNYWDTQKSIVFMVRPSVDITQNVTVGENANITIDLINATGSVKVIIDGKEYKTYPIVDNKLNIDFNTNDLAYGNHNVTFEYIGSSMDNNIFNYWDNETNTYIPFNYDLQLDAAIIDVKQEEFSKSNDEGTVVVELPEDATGTITVFIEGQKEMVFDIVKGFAKIDLSDLKDGNYRITYEYSGNSKYSGFTAETNTTLKNTMPAKIIAKDASITYTNKYSVTVKTKTDAVVSGAKVIFLINGKTYGNAKTDKNGIASITISKTAATYKITSQVSNISVTKKLTVKHLVTLKKVTVKKSAKKLVLTATLGKVNGKYLKNKQVTFKFNGKTYKAKTNSKGVAKYTIKSSVLKKLKAGKKITYQATYLKDTVKKSVKVKK